MRSLLNYNIHRQFRSREDKTVVLYVRRLSLQYSCVSSVVPLLVSLFVSLLLALFSVGVSVGVAFAVASAAVAQKIFSLSFPPAFNICSFSHTHTYTLSSR